MYRKIKYKKREGKFSGVDSCLEVAGISKKHLIQNLN